MILAIAALVEVSAGSSESRTPAADDSESEMGDIWGAILGAFELPAQDVCQT